MKRASAKPPYAVDGIRGAAARRRSAALARLHERLLAAWRRLSRRGGAAAPFLRELDGRPGGLANFLFEQPGAGLLIVDRAMRITRVNAAMRELAGPLADVSADAPALAVFAAEARDRLTTEIGTALRGQIPRPVAAAMPRAAPADDVSVQVSALTLRARDGAPCGALLRVADLSTQRQLEAQLAQAQKLQALGQLAGGIAHDFNNLLSAILGAAETVAARPDLPADLAEDVAQVRASAGRGAALVRQLMAFGRQQTLQPSILDVNEMVSDLSSLLRRLIGSRIRLDLALADTGLKVRADPTQIDQVLVNLAVNARDAMPEGGTLTLRTGHITLHRTQTRGAEAIPPGRYAMVEVADTGIGIPPDVLPRIFDPFFTTRRDTGGHGLGLSTVHGIVRQSDGFLEVDSAPGSGTRLRVFLPRWDDPAGAIPELPPALPATGADPVTPSGTVLLVDDEEPVRRLAERALSRAGWTVIAAEDGFAALAALEQHGGPPLIGLVTDMAMHGMDGVAVVRAVRERTGAPALPALLMSGYAEASLREALAGENQVSFLAKPYALRELTDSFAAIVAGSRRHEPQNPAPD